MTIYLEQLSQEDAIWPWLSDNSMADAYGLDKNYNADLLDAMADLADEQEQAMHESNQSEWEGVIYDDEDAP